MNDLVISIIRTVVPSLVGSFILVLSNWGISVDNAAVAGLTAFTISLFIGGYYALVRLVSKRYPQAEWLLGYKAKPNYKEVK